MPSHRVPTARGPLYLPPPPKEPEIAGALPTALALIFMGAAILTFALALMLGGCS